MKDRYDIFCGLPDTIDDEWIEDIEELEEKMDEYIHLRKKLAMSSRCDTKTPSMPMQIAGKLALESFVASRYCRSTVRAVVECEND